MSTPTRKSMLRALPKFLRPKHKHKPNLTDPFKRWNIVRGDKVAVIDGPCRGQQGTVLAVLRKEKRVVVEGVNMRMKNLKQKYWEDLGSKIMAPASLHYSNINLVDPVTGLPTRVSRRYLEDGTKVRVSKRSGAIIEKPKYTRTRPRNILEGEKDTSADDVLAVTYKPLTDFDAFPIRSGRRPSSENSDIQK